MCAKQVVVLSQKRPGGWTNLNKSPAFSLNDDPLLINDFGICVLVSWAGLMQLNHTSDSNNIWLGSNA